MIDYICELKKRNPYPEDVFLKKTLEEWLEFHKALSSRHIIPDGFIGCCSRKVWDDCIKELEKIIKEQKV